MIHMIHMPPCITIIDTIILYMHTNNAYTYDTYATSVRAAPGAERQGAAGPAAQVGVMS
jgi:hypothetical protein